MRRIVAPFLVLIIMASCSTVLERTVAGTEATASGGVTFHFRGAVGNAFRARVLLAFLDQVPKRFFPVVGNGAYRVRITLDPVVVDYTPIYCVFPILLSFFGCPQGTVSRRYSVAVFSGERMRLISQWEGRVIRPFGLYYMIPRTKNRVEEALLGRVAAALKLFFH